MYPHLAYTYSFVESSAGMAAVNVMGWLMSGISVAASVTATFPRTTSVITTAMFRKAACWKTK